MPTYKRKSSTRATTSFKSPGMRVFMTVAMLVVLIMGAAAARMLVSKSSDLRQQAAEVNCGNYNNNQTTCKFVGCRWVPAKYTCEQSDSGDCEKGAVPGCRSEITSESCTGTVTPCHGIFITANNPAPCQNQKGCFVAPGNAANPVVCRGNALGCETFKQNLAMCSTQQGCRRDVTRKCVGDAGICTRPASGGFPTPVPPNGGGSGGGTGGNGGGNTGGGGSGSGGGNTGGGGSNPAPTPVVSRTITGSVVCTLNNQPVANVPVVTFWGYAAQPQNVLVRAKTNAQGKYSMTLSTDSDRFTTRLTANSKDHDFAFKRIGNPGVQCTDTFAFELCKVLDLPAGTPKAGFDFGTSATATGLKGYESGSNFVFEFKQAKDLLGKTINRYVVRLDNAADTWHTAASDYYLIVPKVNGSGAGSCSGGVCKVTSTELNSIHTFKTGTYRMGVNPIWNSHVPNAEIVELCRADAQVVMTKIGPPPAP